MGEAWAGREGVGMEGRRARDSGPPLCSCLVSCNIREWTRLNPVSPGGLPHGVRQAQFLF